MKILKRIWCYIATEPGFYFALFLVVWLAAWTANGLRLANFDLEQLRELFIFIMSKYTVDSGLNSPWGSSIKGKNEGVPCNESSNTGNHPDDG